ncbi:hypothetical protein HY629_00140 [Candidatus Uhrbacteria bacterium]|nr:hypothetical protein [Candidatus Uhrbacteria bacterium]
MSKKLLIVLLALSGAVVVAGCSTTRNYYIQGQAAVQYRQPTATVKVETDRKAVVLENRCGKGFKPPTVPPPPKGKTVEVECVPDK